MLNPPHVAYTELLLSSIPEMNTDWLTNLLARRYVPKAEEMGRVG